MELKKDFKRLMIVVGLAIVLVFLLNQEFFWKNLVYYFRDFRSPTAEQAKNLDLGPEVISPDTLIIESLGITAPIQYVNEVNEKFFQKALQNGVVHYPGTAQPGEVGNVYIFGHSSDNAWAKGNYKTIFALLPKIEKGAEIIVTNSQGRAFKHIVTESLAASPKALEYLGQDTNGEMILTLQTSYPVGTSFKRWVVIARLEE